MQNFPALVTRRSASLWFIAFMHDETRPCPAGQGKICGNSTAIRLACSVCTGGRHPSLSDRRSLSMKRDDDVTIGLADVGAPSMSMPHVTCQHRGYSHTASYIIVYTARHDTKNLQHDAEYILIGFTYQGPSRVLTHEESVC